MTDGELLNSEDKMMKMIFRGFLAILTSFLIAANAMAIGLGEAKQRGLVGETPSGYLKPVGAASAEVNQLVNQINQKRRAEYNNIATKNGTSLKNVEALAGKKAIDRSKPGEHVFVGGKWVKK